MGVVTQLKDTAIPVVMIPTLDAFVPLLEKHRAEIERIQCKTFQYGITERHQASNRLDVYYPPTEAIPAGGKVPVLHFFYGGSFVSGERRLAPPYDLSYASTGAFFAKRGILTIIADYRLVPHVKYPEPVEDVRDAIGWVVNNGDHITRETKVRADFDNIFVLGHSAGTIYTATLLLHPTLLTPELRSHIRGIVLKSGIFRFPRDERHPLKHTVLQLYGDWEMVEANIPITLLNQAPEELLVTFPEVIMFASEREPEEVMASNTELRETLEKKLGRPVPLTIMKGHNHISPHWALWSGAGEEWGEEVAKWVHEKVASV